MGVNARGQFAVSRVRIGIPVIQSYQMKEETALKKVEPRLCPGIQKLGLST